MSYQKIDNEGKFCSFPGVTVVSMVQEEDSDFWKDVHLLLKDEEISKYFSLLPPQSYHATTMDLMTASQVQGSFEDFIKQKAWIHKKLAETLNTEKEALQLEFQGVHIFCDNVIQLVVNFPEAQRQKIFKVATDLDMGQCVPQFFHMTLAYKFRPCDAAVLEGITLRLNHKFNELFKGRQINLKAPALSSFEDMTAFKPWNGSDYPFNNKQSHESQSMFHHVTNSSLNKGAPKPK